MFLDIKDEKALPSVIDAFTNAGRVTGVVLDSFDDKVVARIRREHPEFQTAASSMEILTCFAAILQGAEQLPPAQFALMQPPAVLPGSTAMITALALDAERRWFPNGGTLEEGIGLTLSGIKRVHDELGVAVFPWTVDGERALQMLVEAEPEARPDGICTNFPERLGDLLVSRGRAGEATVLLSSCR